MVTGLRRHLQVVNKTKDYDNMWRAERATSGLSTARCGEIAEAYSQTNARGQSRSGRQPAGSDAACQGVRWHDMTLQWQVMGTNGRGTHLIDTMLTKLDHVLELKASAQVCRFNCKTYNKRSGRRAASHPGLGTLCFSIDIASLDELCWPRRRYISLVHSYRPPEICAPGCVREQSGRDSLFLRSFMYE